MVDLESFARDHWLTIDEDRLRRYDEVFRVTDANRGAWLDPLGAKEGEVIVDFGCGPGYITAELARIVGPQGAVHGVDLNGDLLARAGEVVAEAGVGDRVQLHHVSDARLPEPDSSVDRVVFKNVLTYVPDLDAILAEAHRALSPDGTVVVIDSDASFVANTVYSPTEWHEFFTAAAAPAVSDPHTGRHLHPALTRAGFEDVVVNVNTIVDTQGAFRPVLDNFIGYVRQFGTMTNDRLDEMSQRADDAMANGTWQMILGQFHVTARRP